MFKMLTQTFSASAPPFIKNFEIGTINRFDHLFYCKTTFSTSHYEDLLFDMLAIPFPEKLSVAVIKRKAEYLAARYAARQLLQSYGCDSVPSLGPDRAPVWPSGWNGSISHSCECAIVIITPEHLGLTPGVDVEFFPTEPLNETADIFTSSYEQTLLKASGVGYDIALLIAFSAKESLYKALYPKVGLFFSFDAASICQINPYIKTVTLELRQTLSSDYIEGKKITCRYTMLDEGVVTIIA